MHKVIGIEHIAIAVKSAQESVKVFTKILGTPPYKEEIVESEGVKTVFFKVGNVKIELLEPLNDNSTIHKFIEKRGEGIHHIALSVENIQQSLDTLKKDFKLINEQPKDGADNKIIAFLHPKTTNKVLIELCQDKE